MIPGSGGSPGEGNGNPLQYSCLENPMDGGAWWATVHRVAKSRTQLMLCHSLMFRIIFSNIRNRFQQKKKKKKKKHESDSTQLVGLFKGNFHFSFLTGKCREGKTKPREKKTPFGKPHWPGEFYSLNTREPHTSKAEGPARLLEPSLRS